jgi:hypothetical protein
MNTIDRLEKIQRNTEISIEEKTSKTNFKNNKIGAKVKRLEEKMYKNRLDLEKFVENANLQLDKNSKLIIAEAEYAQKLGSKYKVVKTTKRKRNV